MKLMYRFAAAALCGSLLLSSACSKRSARAANRVKEEDPYYLAEEFPLTIPVDPDDVVRNIQNRCTTIVQERG